MHTPNYSQKIKMLCEKMLVYIFNKAAKLCTFQTLMSSVNENGYVPITAENYKLIELLKDMNIVTPNPYSNMEVKLTYY